MAIDMSRYVQITSGIGAASSVATRDLIGRFFTANHLVPTGAILEFTSAADVADYFGSSSNEYLRALFYFGWVSKNISSPNKISFARWADVAVGSEIFGKPDTYSLSDFTSISTGDFTLTLGGFTHHLTGIDLTGAASLAAVGELVEDAIQAYSAGGSAWTAANVSFDATRGSFNLVSGTTGADVIAVIAGVTTDLAGPLGWLTGAILSNGAAAQTITQVLTQSTDLSNNFGSFTFMPTLTQDQIVEAATWNNSLTNNIQFMYSVRCTSSNAAALSGALEDIGGCTLTLAPLSGEYPEQAPMMILAATDYDQRNSVQNYMFQIFDLTPSVTTNADANTYDALHVNYYGQTQTAGQFIQFYQRGVMFGLPVDPSDQNVYANEQWLKDSLSAALLGLLLALSKVSANNAGRSQILTTLQGVIDRATFNGTISVGKPLSDTQKLYITNATGDPKAWQQVQSIGYWVGCQITSYTEDDLVQWKAIYTLIYSKDDVIRKIEGTDILI